MPRALPRKKAKGRNQVAVDRETKTNLSLPASELGGSNEKLLLSCRYGNWYWRQSLVRQHRCSGDAATAAITNQRSTTAQIDQKSATQAPHPTAANKRPL